MLYIRDARAIARVMKTVDLYVLSKTRQLPAPSGPPPAENSFCRACGKDLPPWQDCCRTAHCQKKMLKNAGWKPQYDYPDVDPPKQCALEGCSRYVFWPQKNYCSKSCKVTHDREMAAIWKQQRAERVT